MSADLAAAAVPRSMSRSLSSAASTAASSGAPSSAPCSTMWAKRGCTPNLVGEREYITKQCSGKEKGEGLFQG